MHTLPKPLRLSFPCSDRNGHSVSAEVVATRESGYKPWVWRAVFAETGNPPAELMGASERLDTIQADICERVRTLQVVGVVVPIPAQRPMLDRSAAAEVAEVLRVASAMTVTDQRRANLAVVLKELAAESVVGLSMAAKVLGIREC
jgi:hypothetical protein